MPRTTVRAAALISSAAAVTLISGCGLLGQSRDVRMEVTGPGSAAVGTKFAGEPDIGSEEDTVDAAGRAWCDANNQDDPS
ncbi:hypothetical protein ACLFMI_18470 [Pseudonocardia nantongensis]|uniref:hypothetical protein n=1 Tax=Pseudonocardia nantongensis TaxID=1181885 RepID=UPI0039787425